MTKRIAFVLVLSAAAAGCSGAEPPTGPSSLRSSAATVLDQSAGNSIAAHLCNKDGYKSLVRADGTGFRNVGECVSYAARGGTFGSGRRLITINTDTSWLATNVAPAPGWNTDPLFNTAGWTNAVVSTVTPAPCFKGADCIWYDDQNSATEFTWLRKTFTISGAVLTAFLDGGVDDDADIYVNGILVYSVHDGLAGSFGPSPLNIAAFLVPGVNLIAVSAQDNFGFGQNHLFVAQLQIETAAAVPEPSTLALSALGPRRSGFSPAQAAAPAQQPVHVAPGR